MGRHLDSCCPESPGSFANLLRKPEATGVSKSQHNPLLASCPRRRRGRHNPDQGNLHDPGLGEREAQLGQGYFKSSKSPKHQNTLFHHFLSPLRKRYMYVCIYIYMPKSSIFTYLDVMNRLKMKLYAHVLQSVSLVLHNS